METFICPQCGGRTDYNPDEVGREMHLEDRDGQPRWCDYSRVLCPQCGHEALVLRSASPLPP